MKRPREPANPDQPELTFSAKKLARPAVVPVPAAPGAPRPWPSGGWPSPPRRPSGHRVKIAVTLYLPRELAEWLSARAIREGRNTPSLIAEILTAESRRK